MSAGSGTRLLLSEKQTRHSPAPSAVMLLSDNQRQASKATLFDTQPRKAHSARAEVAKPTGVNRTPQGCA